MSRRRHLSLGAAMLAAVAGLLLLPGCSERDLDQPTDGASDELDSASLFAPDKLLAIEIEMDPQDWELIRKEVRDLAGVDLSCPKAPFPKSYTWKQATKVLIDGEQLDNVGIRKKGFIGSVNPVKPSLKLKFDKFVDGQTFRGMERLTLNNNVQDASNMSQCLVYDLSRAAGLAAPRCSFAKVSVNKQVLGIFSNVEAVKTRFLARSFGDSSGDLYEGTVADFIEGKTLNFEPKTDSTDPNGAPIKALTAALKAEDNKLIEALAKVIDIDDFCMFWASSVAAGNLDSYFTKGNNFFVYFDPSNGDRGRFIPWGADAAFGSYKSTVNPMAKPMLAFRLYQHPEGRERFIAALSKLLDTHWQEAHLLAEVDRMQALIGATVAEHPFIKAKAGAGGFAQAVQTLRDFIKGRRAGLQALVQAPPAWTGKAPTAACTGKNPGGKSWYQGKGGFETKFGTLQAKAGHTVGKGKFALSIAGKQLNVAHVGATSGVDPKDGDRVVVAVHGLVNHKKGEVTQAAYFSVPAKAFAAGAKLQTDGGKGDLAGALLTVDPKSGALSAVDALVKGVLKLSKAGSADGDAVAGEFEATWAVGGSGKK